VCLKNPDGEENADFRFWTISFLRGIANPIARKK
jgi:hypothetical protein